MSKSTIIAVAGKGGVGKTSLSATIVRCLTEKYPDKKILAIDADPAVGLSTALGIDVKMTIDDIRKEIIASVDEGDTRGAVELLGCTVFSTLLSRQTDIRLLLLEDPRARGAIVK